MTDKDTAATEVIFGTRSVTAKYSHVTHDSYGLILDEPMLSISIDGPGWFPIEQIIETSTEIKRRRDAGQGPDFTPEESKIIHENILKRQEQDLAISGIGLCHLRAEGRAVHPDDTEADYSDEGYYRQLKAYVDAHGIDQAKMEYCSQPRVLEAIELEISND